MIMVMHGSCPNTEVYDLFNYKSSFISCVDISNTYDFIINITIFKIIEIQDFSSVFRSTIFQYET